MPEKLFGSLLISTASALGLPEHEFTIDKPTPEISTSL